MAADADSATERDRSRPARAVRRPGPTRTVARATKADDSEAVGTEAVGTEAVDSAVKRTGGRPVRKVSAPKAMRYAARQLEELLGRAPESVSALKATEDGWQADVEVLELERVPETTSVMAGYRVTLDRDGELTAYERVRRYTRGQIDRR